MSSVLTAPKVRTRCKWCGEPETSPGIFGCGSVVGQLQAGKCYQITHDIADDPEPCSQPNCWRQGRRQSPERVELQAMEVGTSRVYPPECLKRIERARNVVNESGVAHKIVIRSEDGNYRAGVVPKVKDMEIGESRKYSDSFGIAYGFLRVANSAYLDGRKAVAYTFELLDGCYWIRRIM